MLRIIIAAICVFIAAFLVGEMETSPGESDRQQSKISQLDSSSSADVSGKASFPKLTGRVVDNAGMISASEQITLNGKLEAFEEKSSDQIVVATISSLNGNNLERYANELFRHWELGQAEENNGVLLLIVRSERKIRIEVGYGLEGALTDALSKTIIDQVITPKFKMGDFDSGIVEGVEMIIAVLSGDMAELEARKKRNSGFKSSDIDWGFWLFWLVWGTVFFGPLGLALLAPIFGKKLGKNRYRWLGMEVDTTPGRSGGGSSGGWSGGSSGGGFSGGGGSSGGGGASGGW